MHLPFSTRAKIICDVLSKTVALDALILDSNLRILAGTRNYSRIIGSQCYKDSHTTLVITSPTTIFVEKPKEEPQCKICEGRHRCLFSKPLIVSPIMSDDHMPVGVLVMIATHPQTEQLFLNTPYHELSSTLNELSRLLASLVNPRQTTDYREWVITLSEFMTLLTNRPGVVIDKGNNMIVFSPNFLQPNLEIDKEQQSNPFLRISNDALIDDLGYSTSRSNALFTLTNPESEVSILHAEPRRLFSGFQIYLPELSCPEDYTEPDFIDKNPFSSIVGQSPAILTVKELCARLAKSDIPVLIQGETGTGKDLFAQAIHRASPRREKPLVAINAAAIPEHLFESELFGYEEGTFTGAKRGGKQGKIELADCGTLFLDELAEMPLQQQPKLLRVLETGYIERLGAIRAKPVDIRIIAATNCNLDELLAKSMFRKDLYYRLGAATVFVPPLRERKEDITILIEHFLKLCFKKYGVKKRMHPDATRQLLQYEWPGNIRELRNVIEYAYCVADELCTPDCLPPKVNMQFNLIYHKSSNIDQANFDLRLQELEAIEMAIMQFGSSVQGKKAAAKALGISLSTLYRRINHNASEHKQSNY